MQVVIKTRALKPGNSVGAAINQLFASRLIFQKTGLYFNQAKS
jgi:hypothetical protein